MIVIDEIPDAAGESFVPTELGHDDISHLQYTSGSTRPPVGVEVTHRAVGTNLVQMILSIDLLDRNTHGVSWLPLYHDMGLSMIGFPAVYGGHSTLMSPTAFVRRPQRWIKALSAESRNGRAVTAAPNFAYEWTAQRGLPAPGDDVDLSNVVLIIGSEPVSIDAINAFNKAFAPYGLPPHSVQAVLRHRRGNPVRRHHRARRRGDGGLLRPRTTGRRSRRARRRGRPERRGAGVCGQIARSEWAVIVNPDTATELPDGEIGEIWLQGNNIGRGYWGLPDETRQAFGATLRSRLADGSHADGSAVEESGCAAETWACISTASST